jgi:NADH-quinone oxidoreductase subunit G
MLTLEIDGQNVEVQDGSTVMEAACKLGVYVPHFCYHKKLSIAANCRMCLVEVEKAPKPLPACATPVTQGMKVKTNSPMAKQAQKGVMELLLVNHPLDCPICDQGGECQLQDLAVGYGAGKSRYDEPKRVVFNKNLGSLIATDMTRCIHCTRCVRFGQEVAGVMELGMGGRGEHSEIMAFVGQTVDSELSGNMIDLCPVGALTSKPFRYAARTWELARRKSVSPHDSLGSNQVVQTKHNQVMRVVPLENEAINECWLSDRDRFAYEGLNSSDRLVSPMIKRDGVWEEVSWQQAIEFASDALKRIQSVYGSEQIGFLASPLSTCEELFSLKSLAILMGSANVDTRLRRKDFSLDTKQKGAFWLGHPIVELDSLRAAWVVGADLRSDHPLIAQRIRKAAKAGAKVAALSFTKQDWLMPLTSTWVISPQSIVERLELCLEVLSDEAKVSTLSEIEQQQIAFLKSERPVIYVGNWIVSHSQFGRVYAVLSRLANALSLNISFLGEAANSVGAAWVGAHPQSMHSSLGYQGLNAYAMLKSPLKAYVAVGFEPDADTYDPSLTQSALKSSECVIALSSYKSAAWLEAAEVLLPIAPYTETAGSFVNVEGLRQSFHAVATPLKQTLPAWKVLMALAQSCFPDSDAVYTTFESLEHAMLGALPVLESVLDNGIEDFSLQSSTEISDSAWVRLGDIAPYSSDAIVRRAPALQQREKRQRVSVFLHPEDAERLGCKESDKLQVIQAGLCKELSVVFDSALSLGTVRLSHLHALGGLMDAIEIKKS